MFSECFHCIESRFCRCWYRYALVFDYIVCPYYYYNSQAGSPEPQGSGSGANMCEVFSVSEPGYVSVCPFCVYYHKCGSEPLLYPLDESTPFELRIQDYKQIVKDCELYCAPFFSEKR